jgi:hypothetical protein
MLRSRPGEIQETHAAGLRPDPLMSWCTNIDSKRNHTNNLKILRRLHPVRGNSQATGPSSRKILILRRLHPVRGNSQATGPSSRKFSVLRRLHPVRGNPQATGPSSRAISGDCIQFEENLRRLDQVRGNYETPTNDSISKLISYLTYICSYLSSCRSRGDVETSSLSLEILLQAFK